MRGYTFSLARSTATITGLKVQRLLPSTVNLYSISQAPCIQTLLLFLRCTLRLWSPSTLVLAPPKNVIQSPGGLGAVYYTRLNTARVMPQHIKGSCFVDILMRLLTGRQMTTTKVIPALPMSNHFLQLLDIRTKMKLLWISVPQRRNRV